MYMLAKVMDGCGGIETEKVQCGPRDSERIVKEAAAEAYVFMSTRSTA